MVMIEHLDDDHAYIDGCIGDQPFRVQVVPPADGPSLLALATRVAAVLDLGLWRYEDLQNPESQQLRRLCDAIAGG